MLNNTVVALLFLVPGDCPSGRGQGCRRLLPHTDDIAKRPRVERLFWHLTLMWAVVALCKATVTFWLLQSQSVTNFVLFKDTFFLTTTVLAVTVTVAASVRVARKEGLLHRRHDEELGRLRWLSPRAPDVAARQSPSEPCAVRPRVNANSSRFTTVADAQLGEDVRHVDAHGLGLRNRLSPI